MPKNKKYGKGSMSAQNTVAVKNYGRHEGSTIRNQLAGISDVEEADKPKRKKNNKKRMAY